jgi:hypothetical protein
MTLSFVVEEWTNPLAGSPLRQAAAPRAACGGAAFVDRLNGYVPVPLDLFMSMLGRLSSLLTENESAPLTHRAHGLPPALGHGVFSPDWLLGPPWAGWFSSRLNFRRILPHPK